MGLQIFGQPLDEWLAAVESGDVDFITLTPGVGKKMAQKIIVELKGKLDLSEKAVLRHHQREALEAALTNLVMIKPVCVQAVLEQAPDGLIQKP